MPEKHLDEIDMGQVQNLKKVIIELSMKCKKFCWPKGSS